MAADSYIVAGPTASGKTALAVALARRVHGAVINCDSIQLYADLPLLSAQPTPAEQENIPHHLFGVLAGHQRGSVASYLDLVRPVLAAVRAAGQVPVLCGGTGLYIKAMLEGLAAIPPVPALIHEATVAMHRAIGGAALRAKLAAVDTPLAARLNDGDTQRLIRGWAVWQATGTPLSVWQQQTHQHDDMLGRWHAHLLLPPRAALYEKINRRFDVMMQQGAEDEVRQLLARGYAADLPVTRACGVPEIAAYLRGESTRAQAVEKAQQSSRHYAKRQITWFKHQFQAVYAAQVTVHDCFGHDAFGKAVG